MAKSKVKTPKLHEMPKPEGAVAVADPSEVVTEPAAAPPKTPFDPPINPRAPKAPVKAKTNVPPRSMTFFQRLQSIPFEDWGARAKVKVYRLAPLIDRLRGSENKFIRIYEEALTEDRLKQDSGSGRYRLYLNYKGAGEQGEKELDVIEIDILDPKFPPNIPPGEWMDDPRNSAWAWAKPAPNAGPNYQIQQPVPAAAPVDAVLQGMRVATEMRKELREEMAPPAAIPPATPPTAVDPWSAAEKILNMRSDNPMVTFVTAQLTAMQDTMRQAADREAALQKELRDMLIARAQQPTQQQKGLLEQITELAGVADKLAPLAGLFGFTRPNPATVGEPVVMKSRMSGTMEFLSDLVPKIIDSPIMNAIAQKITQAPQAPNPTINVTPQPTNGTAGQQPQQQPNPQAELFRFVNQHITPPLIEFLRVENSGTEFAQWVYTGFPLERLEALQQITHEMMPGQKGAPVIIQLYKHAHNGLMWKEFLGEREAQFTKFVEEFCAWRPPSDEDEAPAPISTDESRETANQGDF